MSFQVFNGYNLIFFYTLIWIQSYLKKGVVYNLVLKTSRRKNKLIEPNIIPKVLIFTNNNNPYTLSEDK